MMHVYVVAASESAPVKIGVASSPVQRLAELQIGNPLSLMIHWTLECPNGVAEALERAAHALLEGRRIRGEWFDVSVKEAIQSVRTARDNAMTFVEHSREEWLDVMIEERSRSNANAEKQKRYRQRLKENGGSDPWVAAGMSRATWFRRKSEASSSS